MAYRVFLAESAETDAYAIYLRVAIEALLRSPVWFEELTECLSSLHHLPERCLLARGAEQAKREIRCLLFGNTVVSTGFSGR